MKGELAVDLADLDAFGQRSQLDPAFQGASQRDQVRHQAAEPIEPPHNELIAAAHHLQGERQTRPRRPGAANAILIEAGAASLGQRIPLQIKILVVGLYAGVADDGGGHRGRKPVQGSGLQTLKPNTHFLPAENQEKRSTHRQLASAQEIPPFPARRRTSLIHLTYRKPAPSIIGSWPLLMMTRQAEKGGRVGDSGVAIRLASGDFRRSVCPRPGRWLQPASPPLASEVVG